MEGATRLFEKSAVPPTRCMRFWLALRDGVGRFGPLTLELADGKKVLCVFSFEEEARLFFRLDARGGWRARATGIGALVSVLSGPCRGWSWSSWTRFRKRRPRR